MPRSWLASAGALVDALPPTLPALLTAVRVADQAALLLAQASGRTRPTDAAASAALLCSSALGCLESTTARPLPGSRLVIDPPTEPDDPAHLPALEHRVHECIGLAVEVLDNEDEPLDTTEVRQISRAVDLLARACGHCVGGPR